MTERLTDQELDDLIRHELLSVSAPAELRQKLLRPELLAPGKAGVLALFGLSANDGFFRRVLPVAACLVAALGIALWNPDDRHAALAEEIFSHIYMEEGLLAQRGDLIPLPTVSSRMEDIVGAHLDMSQDVENLEVTFAKDCWVAKTIGFHLIMKGETGAVTVMMIPSQEKDVEFNISDAKFSGVVTPTEGGYLVVVGNKREPISAYRNLLTGHLEWEY
ncbi:MAG: hypothetical protein RLZZ227_619 [Pseudomonadota bacterium]